MTSKADEKSGAGADRGASAAVSSSPSPTPQSGNVHVPGGVEQGSGLFPPQVPGESLVPLERPGARVGPAKPAGFPEPGKRVAEDFGPDVNDAAGRKIDLLWAGVMVGSVVLVFLLLSLFGGVAVPLLLALATAYTLNPVVTLLERRGMNRSLGTSLTFAALALVSLGVILYLVPVFREEAAKLPGFVRAASVQVLPKIEEATGVALPELLRKRTSELADEASSLVQSIGPAAATLLARFAGNTARLVTTLLGLLVVPVLAFFFLRDFPRLVAQAQGLIPRPALALVSRRFAAVDAVLSAFARGQLTVGAILAGVYSIGLSAARLDLAIVIGVIAGFGNMVPYLGTGVGVLLAAIALMLSWQGPWQVAAILGTFVVGQALEGFVITPRIVGEKVGLPSVAVILAVLAFGELFGFVGVLLAVPTSAILKVVLEVVIERYRSTRLYRGTAS